MIEDRCYYEAMRPDEYPDVCPFCTLLGVLFGLGLIFAFLLM